MSENTRPDDPLARDSGKARRDPSDDCAPVPLQDARRVRLEMVALDEGSDGDYLPRRSVKDCGLGRPFRFPDITKPLNHHFY